MPKEDLNRGIAQPDQKNPESDWEDRQYVAFTSHKDGLRDKKIPDSPDRPYITAANHGLWLGKIFHPTVGSVVRQTFRVGDYMSDEKIYSRELIVSAKDYLYKHLKPGQKVRVYLCQFFSELFNGKSDLEGTYSLQNAAKWVHFCGCASFKKDGEFHCAHCSGEDLLEFISIEHDPAHRDLMGALKASVSVETGRFDAELFGKVAPYDSAGGVSFNPSSLEIFQALCSAAERSKFLSEKLKRTVPKKIRENAASEKEIKCNQYYAMTEMAVRLREILSGRYIHSGNSRQGVYDDIIREIIKDGRRRDKLKIPELASLTALFGDAKFEMIHFSNEIEKNIHYQQKEQARREVGRLIKGFALVIFALTAIQEGCEYIENRPRATVIDGTDLVGRERPAVVVQPDVADKSGK